MQNTPEDRKAEVIAYVEKAMQNDERAFNALYSECAETILLHCKNLIVDKGSYEDVAQEVALAIYRGISTLKVPEAYFGWMHRIIRNVCINHNKKFMREAESRLDASGDESLVSIATDHIDDNPERKITSETEFEKLLGDMPPVYRETIIMRYYDEMSYKEIAAAMGTAVSTVSTNIIKAKKLLKKLLNASGEYVTGENKMKESYIGVIVKAGISGIIPSSAIGRFSETAYANAHAAPASAGSVGVSQSGVVKPATVSGGIIAGVVCVALLAVGIAAYALNSHGSSADSAPSSPPAEEPAKTTPKVKDSASATADFANPHIRFTDENGADTPLNVSSITITDIGSATSSVEWSVTAEDGSAVLSGSGAEVGSELASLHPGKYRAQFVLKSESGAECDISRTFVIR